MNDVCNTVARAEHKLTLQSIQKSFSKFCFSNTECPVTPDTNTGYDFVWIKVHIAVKYELLTFTISYLTHSLQSTKTSIPKCKPPLQTLLSSYWEASSFYSSGVICMKVLEIFAFKSSKPMGNCSYIIFFIGPSHQTNEWQWVQQIWRQSNSTVTTIPAVLNLFSGNTLISNKFQSASSFHVQVT